MNDEARWGIAVCGTALFGAALLCALTGGARARTAEAAGYHDLVILASIDVPGVEADTPDRGSDDRFSSQGDRAVEADDDDDCDCGDDAVRDGSEHKAEPPRPAMRAVLPQHATVTEPVEYETVRRLLAGPSLQVRPPPSARLAVPALPGAILPLFHSLTHSQLTTRHRTPLRAALSHRTRREATPAPPDAFCWE